MKLTGNRVIKSHKQSTDKSSMPDIKNNILLVEDDAVNTEVIADILDTLGYNIDFATNGQQALEIYDHNRHVLILMDCEMPVMNGYDASRQIRMTERTQNLAPVPIIALTSHTASKSGEKCIANGMSDLLTKPASILMLHTMLNKWLEKSHSKPTENLFSSIKDNKSVGYINTAQNLSAILDYEVLNKIQKNRKSSKSDLVNRVINIYLEQSSSLISQLLTAAHSANLETVMRIAHTLKSSSRNVGAIKLSDVCREVESQCTQGIINDFLIDRILSDYSDTDKALRDLLHDSMAE